MPVCMCMSLPSLFLCQSVGSQAEIGISGIRLAGSYLDVSLPRLWHCPCLPTVTLLMLLVTYVHL